MAENRRGAAENALTVRNRLCTLHPLPYSARMSISTSGLATRPPLERTEAVRIARTFKAVADPTRLQLLSLIQSSPGGEACVRELSARLDLRQPTVSHHLKTMTEAGLLTRERRGPWAWYAVDRAGLTALQTLLSHTAAQPPPTQRP